MTVIAYFICSVVFSALYYVQAYKSGLTAKKWALAGLAFGPMVYPLFKSRQRFKLIRSRGFNNCFMSA